MRRILSFFTIGTELRVPQAQDGGQCCQVVWEYQDPVKVRNHVGLPIIC